MYLDEWMGARVQISFDLEHPRNREAFAALGNRFFEARARL